MGTKFTLNNDENDKLLISFCKIHNKYGTIQPISKQIFMVKNEQFTEAVFLVMCDPSMNEL